MYEIRSKVGSGTLRDDTTAIHEVEVMTDVLDEGQVLLDHDDRDLQFIDELVQDLANLLDDVRLDPFGGLVEHQHLGTTDQGARDRELLLLPSGQISSHPVRHGLEDRKQVVQFFGNSGNTVGSSLQADLEVFLDRQSREDASSLWHQPNPARARASGASRVMSVSPRWMEPLVGCRTPITFIRSVLFPTPLRPIMQVTFPSGMFMSIWSNTSAAPYENDRF